MISIKVSDIETDGLLDTVSKFHCAVVIDYFTGETIRYAPWDFKKYIEDIERWSAEGHLLAYHNGIKYDVPALNILKKKHFGKRLNINKKSFLDTLVCTRLVYSNIKDIDGGLMRSGRLPSKMFGSHSLKAWGYRLGILKGEYGEQENAWAEYTVDMMDYCEQDVRVTVSLLEKLFTNEWYFTPNQWGDFSESIRLEHDAAWVLAKMERNGFPFDTKSAVALYAQEAGHKQNLYQELVKTFGSWYRPKGGTTPFLHPVTGQPLDKYPRVKYPKAGSLFTKSGKLSSTLYYEGRPFTPVEHVTFNPASRDHIVKVLKDIGWTPVDFTDAGNPVVDDDALSIVIEHKLVPEEYISKVELIREYLTVNKLLGQLAEGDNAWLRHERDGYIHGSVNPNGAVTGRATHAFPNVAQVPSIRKYRGKECRSLFGACHHIGKDGKPWIQVGVDASGLELRCLGHFMARYDDGAYIDVILNGDIHWQNCIAAGLHPNVPRDKHNEAHEAARNNAKTFIYGFLYGAGAAKIGEIVGKFGEEGKKAGKELIESFLNETPAIKALREAVADTLIADAKWVNGEQQIKWKRKWIRGMDGRKVHVRSPHAALNTLLQSAGALICKKWVVVLVQMLEDKGYVHGWDGDFALMGWIHDEVQIAARTEEIAHDIINMCQEAMRFVGESWNFRCPLDTEGKIGRHWADCH
ncbi:Phage DNA-directed DNA polymerase (EC [Escherichia phage vB_Eco_Titus]|nr:Phage DNA-directed DNA polymerase (EC [Escherichia phage vB_Eco_Titus]